MTERKSDFECQAKLRMSLYALRGSDHENFGELLNTAYSAEKGREVMNTVAFRGYKFIYDALPGLNGVCDFENKVVKLDSFHRQAELAPTLIHECTHVLQVDRLCEKTGAENAGDVINALNARDFIKLNRAFEADACAHQAAYVYQMKDKNPLAFEQEMQTPMTQAYVAEMDKSGDEKKAMQASFQAWYGYKKYQTAYEKQFQFQILKNAAKREASGEKTVSLSNRDIAGFCRFQGETYISPDFFDRAESLSVSPAFKQEIQKTGDPSVAALPVRGEKSSVNPVVARQIASARGR